MGERPKGGPMYSTPIITIRKLPKSKAIRTYVERKIEKINRFCQSITHFDVVLEPIQRHKHQGKLYNCRIIVTVPKATHVVTHPVNEDIYVAIRDAFHAMKDILQSYVLKRRGQVKMHELPYHGFITKIFHREGYGFISSDNVEYYFSPQNLMDVGFDKLELGMEVQFIQALADEGFQAHRVSVGKHHDYRRAPPLLEQRFGNVE